MKKAISFKYYLDVQAKYLQYLNYKTHISIVALAQQFAESLHDRLHYKYIVRGTK